MDSIYARSSRVGEAALHEVCGEKRQETNSAIITKISPPFHPA